MIKSITVTKVLLVLVPVFLFILGVNYQARHEFDYSKVEALEVENGATKVSFKLLGGFEYNEDKKIPEPVMVLNGEVVQVTGFMLPVDFDEGRVNSFLLMNSRLACCFGVMPRENEFIYVEMPGGKTTKFMTDMPVMVAGKLLIGGNNLVGSLYTMDAYSIKKADNL